MSKILIFAAGVVTGYALYKNREQPIEKIANAVTDKTGKAWASATDYIRNNDSDN